MIRIHTRIEVIMRMLSKDSRSVLTGINKTLGKLTEDNFAHLDTGDRQIDYFVVEDLCEQQISYIIEILEAAGYKAVHYINDHFKFYI